MRVRLPPAVRYYGNVGREKSWSDERLTECVAKSRSIAGVMRMLGLTLCGGNHAMVKRHIARLELDTSHFSGQSWSRGDKKNSTQVLFALTPLLISGNIISQLRKRLIDSGLRNAKCAECGITEWQGKIAPLQVDHIDGDRKNNQIENLRILCANCHMLTDTWGRRKITGL